MFVAEIVDRIKSEVIFEKLLSAWHELIIIRLFEKFEDIEAFFFFFFHEKIFFFDRDDVFKVLKRRCAC